MHFKSLRLNNPFKHVKHSSSVKRTEKASETREAPPKHRPKWAKSVKLNVKSFFQKLFGNSHETKAQQHAAHGLITREKCQDLDPNVYSLVMAIIGSDGPVYDEESISEPETIFVAPTNQALCNDLGDAMGELGNDMLDKHQTERTCVVANRTLIAKLTLSADGSPMLTVSDDTGRAYNGTGGLYATLLCSDKTLRLSDFNVRTERTFNEKDLTMATEASGFLLRAD